MPFYSVRKTVIAMLSSASVALPTGALAAPRRASADVGSLTVIEYSDYQCPYCSRAHTELRAALAGRRDVRIEHRNFPLDPTCNPAVRRPLHRDACALARAAICATDQGRFWQMNDALYANQAARRPVEDVAATAGLDLAAFRRCIIDAETSKRLSQEIDAGIRTGITATPTYVVRGAVYTGRLPASVLRPAAPPPRR